MQASNLICGSAQWAFVIAAAMINPVMSVHEADADQGRNQVIGIQGLRFGYGRHLLYDGFDLDIATPGLYGLFGRNGSGKSTLLKLIAGLLFRKGGAIRVGEHDPERRHPDFLADIYLVPEEFHLPNLSCEQLARRQAGFYPLFSQTVFDEAIATFEIDPKARFESMSLGGRKKAVIAFALATRTSVLLLDEPTNGMDIVGRDQFRQLLSSPQQAERIVIISTHQAHDLEQVIAKILFVDGGRLALSASMDALASSLRMGVVDSLQRDTIPRLIYDEAIGAQTGFIASRAEGEAAEPVHLELLYRALCRSPERLLAAVAGKESSRV